MTSFLERVWEHREEVLYRGLFGDLGEGIYTIPAAVFTDVFQQDPDPSWLHVGVFACPPHAQRDHWVYVTSGLTNPWGLDAPPEDPELVSGLGVELVFPTDADGPWPIHLLHRLAAVQLLLASGRLGDRPLLGFGDRVPLAPRLPEAWSSALTHVVLTAPHGVPPEHRLGSGWLLFAQVTGLTPDEVAYGRQHGHQALMAHLADAGADRVTRVRRGSALDGDGAVSSEG